MVPSKSEDKTSYEIWTRKILVCLFLRFGVVKFFKRVQSDKVRSKSDKCIFVGVSEENLGILLLLLRRG